MNNSHDEIKRLLKASRTMLSTKDSINESFNIRKKHNLLSEQEIEFEGDNVTKKISVGDSIEDNIRKDEEKKPSKSAKKSSGIHYVTQDCAVRKRHGCHRQGDCRSGLGLKVTCLPECIHSNGESSALMADG